jgi:hypothetical protein
VAALADRQQSGEEKDAACTAGPKARAGRRASGTATTSPGSGRARRWQCALARERGSGGSGHCLRRPSGTGGSGFGFRQSTNLSTTLLGTGVSANRTPTDERSIHLAPIGRWAGWQARRPPARGLSEGLRRSGLGPSPVRRMGQQRLLIGLWRAGKGLPAHRWSRFGSARADKFRWIADASAQLHNPEA